MKRQEIIEALKQGLQVYHKTNKQLVRVNLQGILYSYNYRNGMPYELTVNDFEDCFTGA